jgi:hypothetical protein
MNTYTEKRINIHYLYPGAFFPETSSQTVQSTDIPKEIPADCYGFYFTETEIAHVDDKEFVGKTQTVSKTYIVGEAIPVDKIPSIDRGQDTHILKTNIRNNSPTLTGIKTHLGSWQMESDDMVAISPRQFKFDKPTIYKNVKK